ncbi:GNAT family N-acetyltransferase [Staphylococcus edaphicus]|uniref:GNAT family N-acetyltransferase n=1 Tax=Staphylococcus edaphicus TaxID=1955013 RepID=A0A2C6WNI9_9STAP|nr:GNAT family N-acetyltransferase [Staphylococcus edaphicus]PHK49017.1 GNAT family N-acetyltransferase [Staphylococcus edaphicus]UQW81342.1 GNAT family N-acetyltransferase [Staphylococcus edaphicus]
MIKCVCLVVEFDEQLLLVQARNREKYYFPGGKIDANESYTEALTREIQEELQVDLPESSLVYLSTVVGEAYPQKNTQTELNCFKTTAEIDWNSVVPDQEITDLKWVSKHDHHQIAPAVLTWIDEQSKQDDVVYFVPYKADLMADIERINLSADDLKFTKTPKENIVLAENDEERHPTLVYNGKNQCIGFFTLHEGKGVAPYSENKHAIFFRSFSIDVNYRGSGYGKQIIKALPNYLKINFPTIQEICLTVNDDNDIAQQLYKQCHYHIVGEATLENRPVYILKREIK